MVSRSRIGGSGKHLSIALIFSVLKMCYTNNMSKQFNLFLLSSALDRHPRSWVCVKGMKLRGAVDELERRVRIANGWSREKLSKEISLILNCHSNTVRWALYSKREFYPIPIIQILASLRKSERSFLKEIEGSIEYLKVNSASAKPVRAVKELSKNLAKILGAFMADGSLSMQVVMADSNPERLKAAKKKLSNLNIFYSFGSAPSRKQYYISVQINRSNRRFLNEMFSLSSLIQTHHNIELTDEYKNSVEAFIGWIKKEFDINPTGFYKKSNAWRVVFSNKILARYLTRFFDVVAGPKTYDAFEPAIIKKSRINTKKEFAKGALMFDGCVSIKKNILFSTKSEALADSIATIWREDEIRFGRSKNARGEYILFTTAGNKKGKLLSYFEKNTQKWKLLNWLAGDLSHSPMVKNGDSISLENIFKLLRKIKSCDIIFLQKYFHRTHLTIGSYLKVLKDQRKIRLSNWPKRISRYVNKDATILLGNKAHEIFFKKIKERFGEYQNCAIFLGVHKSTFSAWRVRKNRIPLFFIDKLCRVVDLDLGEILKDIEKIDREVAEII